MKMASNLEAIFKIAVPHQGQSDYQPGLNRNQVISRRAEHPIKLALPFWRFEANPR
jgi:hypothetical protein